MTKGILAFVLLFFVFFVGIDTVRRFTGKEALEVTKAAVYSILCAALTILSLIALVEIF